MILLRIARELRELARELEEPARAELTEVLMRKLRARKLSELARQLEEAAESLEMGDED
jgi:hypothetical protein